MKSLQCETIEGTCVKPSQRIQSISDYAFEVVELEVEKLRDLGIEPIDFGVGDPTIPTPQFIREQCKEALDRYAGAGYPSYIGSEFYRRAIADWTRNRFGVDLDPDREVVATIGGKEGIVNFSEGFLDPGDPVLVPNPGYPPYARGTLLSEGVSYFLPLTEENGFLVDLEAIPDSIAERAKILWITNPQSPTGTVAGPDYLERLVAWGRETRTLIAADEVYSEIYFEEPPHSILEYGKDGVVVFQSLSKRSAMTGWRIGWCAGDPQVLEIFKKVKTNVDSGAPSFIQEAAGIALGDEWHVEGMRRDYRLKRDMLVAALTDAGLDDCTPQATFYIWQRVPEGMSSEEFSRRLLAPDLAIVTTPGPWLSEPEAEGVNPGEGYVRFALVPSVEETEKAAERLRQAKFC